MLAIDGTPAAAILERLMTVARADGSNDAKRVSDLEAGGYSSCKGRGVCPSCNAKRAHVTAMHLVEQVLPHVPYRQWTLSFPHRVRWVLSALTPWS